MSQHTNVVLEDLSYTRTDYTALRAFAQRIPIQAIADRYYSEDSPQVEIGLERFLIGMRDDLIERAIEHNPHFAEALKGARQGGTLTVKALDILFKAADAPKAVPQATDPISKWFRPKTTAALRSIDLHSLAELADWIRRRDRGWWKSIPRIGAGRAKVIVDFINRNSQQLGEIRFAEPIDANVPTLVLDPRFPSRLAPLELVALPEDASRDIAPFRSTQFCFIGAKNDLEATFCYLSRFNDSKHTYRAYKRELERLLLFAVLIQKKPFASFLVEDCNAYIKFLEKPHLGYVGPKVPKSSPRWKPFADESMSAKSIKQALTIIRSFFKFLVDARYLVANPWNLVEAPKLAKTLYPMKIERALQDQLWEKLIAFLTEQAKPFDQYQYRVALAAILLMGDSGLRRHEVVISRRDKLCLYNSNEKIYTLEVRGKGMKDRLVPVSERTVNALRSHWIDRGLDFDTQVQDIALIAPLVIPRHAASLKKHEEKEMRDYSVDAINRLIKSVWNTINKSSEAAAVFTPDEIRTLESTSPHAFRHTFATLAMEADMPMDVTQAILGHESQDTTAIYARTREKRLVSEAAKFFSKKQI